MGDPVCDFLLRRLCVVDLPLALPALTVKIRLFEGEIDRGGQEDYTNDGKLWSAVSLVDLSELSHRETMITGP